MSDLSYWIYSGDQPVTNATGVQITDEETARRVASEVSRGQPDATISIVSRDRQPAAEWTSVVARYLDGEEIPYRWRVDFHGYLMDADHTSLSRAGIFYENGRSEIGPDGVFRSGIARNVVTLEADDGDGAIEKVRDALGPIASECSEWHVYPAW
jgi:hypothetical protein